jgi:hypothetical protein
MTGSTNTDSSCGLLKVITLKSGFTSAIFLSHSLHAPHGANGFRSVLLRTSDRKSLTFRGSNALDRRSLLGVAGPVTGDPMNDDCDSSSVHDAPMTGDDMTELAALAFDDCERMAAHPCEAAAGINSKTGPARLFVDAMTDER